MDRERFDELARLLATKGSRRSAVGTLLGVAILGHDPGEAGAQRGEKARKDRNKNRNRDDGAAEAEGEAEQSVEATENAAAPEADAPEIQTEAQGGGRGKRKRKAKGRNRRSGGAQDHSRAEATRCCGTKSCALPTAGSNRFECNFAGQNLSGRTMTGVNFGKIDGRKTNFSNANVKGANFGEACLQGANFKGANVSSTNFAKACLFGADFTGARNLNPSVNFSTALLCGTVLADGTVSDRDCGRATACCAACDAQRPCPTGQVCCNGRCRAGDCCASGDCDPEQCQTVACTSFQCEYTPVPNGLGPLCNTTCCNGICCPSGQTCVGGRCTSACPPERPNRCVDGACQVCCNDNQCPTNQAPICGPNRTCLPCSSATQCSNANKGNLCCSGQCRTGVCCADAECTTPGAPDCVSNQCVCDTNNNQPCGADLTCCASGCENLQTDRENCGVCGRACPANAVCVGGQCQCGQGFKLCGNQCIANALCCTGTTPGCAEPTPNCCVENGIGICRDCCGGEDCSNPTPICNGAGTCVACASDGECGGGEVCCGGSCLEGGCCAADDCEPRQCRDAACAGNRCDYAVQPNGPGTLCDAAGEFCCGGSCCTQGQVCDTRPETDVCCTPQPRDTTCGVGTTDPKCGTVIDNCGQEVTCGACDERLCQTGTCNDDLDSCNYTPVPDNQTGPGCPAPGFCCDGDECCQAGDVCLANGCCTPEPRDTTCAVNSASPKCGDVINNCGETVTCGSCAERVCHTGACTGPDNTCTYIPVTGGTCPATGSGTGTCCGGACCEVGDVCDTRPDPDVCCTPITQCPTDACGNVPNGCGGTIDCGDCAERLCQNATCDAENACGYTPVIDGQPGTLCPAPGFCCDGDECCVESDVCLADGCCTPETEQQTCRPAGGSQRCGTSVVNNCGQLVDCGECDERQCFTATCNGDPNGTCQYEAVFREPGPDCDTVCCQDAQGDPVCCDADITSCTASGLCVCADDNDCAADERCCNGSCISDTLCCGEETGGTCALAGGGTGVCCAGICSRCCGSAPGPGPNTCGQCNNQDPCQSPPVLCGTTEGGAECVCYSSTEDTNLCIQRSEATCDQARRPDGCNSSADCASNEFCAPLNSVNVGGTGNCCGRADLGNSVGFCVPYSVLCRQPEPPSCSSATCDGCCNGDTCELGNDPQTCGQNGEACETCNPEVACVNGDCVCSSASCPDGCCAIDANDRPFCDNTLRPCGDTCIPLGQCCGAATSTCAARECNTVSCVGNECVYTASGIAGPCASTTGVCVRDPDGSGRCVISNNGTTSCIGADACGEVNSPPQCGTVNGYDNGGDCGCYSTPEGAGLCLRRTSSFTYPESAVGCAANAAGLAAQPPCNDSTECPAGAVCVSLVGSGLPICCTRDYGDGQNNQGKTGFCVSVEPGLCATPRPGTCVPLTPAQACGARECGAVSDGCEGTVNCGPLTGGACPTGETCDPDGLCQPIPPTTCENCTAGCCRDEICQPGNTRTACGHSGGVCESCNPEVACVNGVCTCTRTSCAQGCCTVVDGRPFCDNTLRPCGDTCIARTACCHGLDPVYPETTPGCRPNEACAVNSSGFGECQCGGSVCQRNQGCCELVNDQPTCNTDLRPCGAVCIDKTLCCREGVQGCDDGVACTSETCQPATGTGQTPPPGICMQTFPNRTCTEACAAGKGYGNYFPANQREVRCASAGTVYPTQPCLCWRTTENQNVCTESVPGNITPFPCRVSSECPAGQVCIRSGLTTGTNTCAPICQ